jgi:hypothetical protein
MNAERKLKIASELSESARELSRQEIRNRNPLADALSVLKISKVKLDLII